MSSFLFSPYLLTCPGVYFLKWLFAISKKVIFWDDFFSYITIKLFSSDVQCILEFTYACVIAVFWPFLNVATYISNIPSVGRNFLFLLL